MNPKGRQNSIYLNSPLSYCIRFTRMLCVPAAAGFLLCTSSLATSRENDEGKRSFDCVQLNAVVGEVCDVIREEKLRWGFHKYQLL